MRKFFIIPFVVIATLVCTSVVFAYTSPGRPLGFVNDFANVIPDQNKTSLEAKLVALEQQTGFEISVVTINSLDNETIETFAVKLFEDWGIGKAQLDNGLLVLVAPNDGEVRIEVGYGLEPVVTDVASFVIINDLMIPEFKNENYAGGIEKAIYQIEGLINKDPYALSLVESRAQNMRGDMFSWAIALLVFAFQLIPVIVYSKSWWLGGVLGFGLGFLLFSALVPALVIAVIGLILDFILSKKFGGTNPHGVWFGGIGGGRGGFGGGGFGGFGGGSSGGGGASGRW